MKVVLDTHTLLWATTAPHLLSRRAAEIILDERCEILVSAASAWEIATNVRLGKLALAEDLGRNLLERMADAGYSLHPISFEEAIRAGRLPGTHRDPFDRMLAAQALEADIEIISSDTKLDQFGVRRIW